jgi:hypothetical protein
MKIYDKYILILASLLLATTVIVAAIGEVRLDLYFSIYVIEALVLTELYVYLNPKAKRGLNKVNYALFAGFLVIVAAKVAEILWGIKLL